MPITITIFGSYFPVWAVCALLGLGAAVGVHLLLRLTGLLASVPLPVVFYMLTTLFASTTVWLVTYGP
jgi:uncharacterized membrane protein